MDDIRELLANTEFVRWVKNPDPELDTYWSKWMDANPSRIKTLKMAREVVLGFQFETKPVKSEFKDEVLREILSHPHENLSVAEFSISNKGNVARKSIWLRSQQGYRVAAIILLVLTFSWIYSLTVPNVEPILEEVQIANITKSTREGERLNFRLPDGSTVWLNSNSSLSFPENFTQEERAVSLEGEAFFEISHNPVKPFRVTSSNLITTALGTSFNITTLEAEKVKVALLTGKVKIENRLDESREYLIPGQQLSYSLDENKSIIDRFDPTKVIGWKDGVLAFDHDEFHNVVQSLEKWYGVKISVQGNPARKWDVSINFDNASLEQVLFRLSYIEDFEFDIQGKNVTINLND